MHDPETEAWEQDAVDSARTGVEPWPRAFFASRRLEDSRPDMLDAGVKSPLERSSQSFTGSFKQDRIEALPPPGPLPSGLPDPSVRASCGGGSGQANLSANVQRRASRKASIDAGPSSTLPKPWLARKLMSEGKLTEAVEAAPTDKAARFRARKASITAGDELYEGAKGTKEGPGRSVSRSRPMRTETLALGGMTPIFTPEAAHSFLRSYLSEDAMAANIRSALNNEAGSSGSHASRSSDGSGQTELTARDQRVPTPSARKPDDIWAAVRARRATSAALNSTRRQRLQDMRQEQARFSCRRPRREHPPVGEIVRV